MRIRDFEIDQLRRGEKQSIWLDIAARAGGSDWRLPLQTVIGAEAGPTLLVLAGVHGDEYEGIAAIPQVYRAIKPQDLRGCLLMAPVCNMPAYEALQRASPIDGLNLARVFPGDVDGSITRQIAFWLTRKLLSRADFLIDLHTGGIAYEMPTLIGYLHDGGELGQASQAAAAAFGAPVMWGHPLPLPPGRSISAATTLGIPSLYTEAPGGAGCDPDVVACFCDGVTNVMKHLGMIRGGLRQRRLTHHLLGDGNLDTVIDAPGDGFFQREVSLLENVKRGQRLGAILDPTGAEMAPVEADQAGLIIMLRGIPPVKVGDGIAHITQPYHSGL
ncbi:MAG: succinylglutamate desuccinylase/aspartoacylase family protein [Chloroflexi bacterium]|nr:succinylglutamate desuccinylase/aspartoacylase family protein [Chloroflexota bacterium]